MKLAQRARNAQPFHAMSIGARARQIEAAGRHVAKLSLGEPDFGAPPGVHEAMRATMDGRPLRDCRRCARPSPSCTPRGTG